jgi:hypothetical protein
MLRSDVILELNLASYGLRMIACEGQFGFHFPKDMCAPIGGWRSLAEKNFQRFPQKMPHALCKSTIS